MNPVTTLLALVAVLCAIVGLNVAVAVYGWGLEPRSWWWIVGGGVFGHAVLAQVYARVIAETKKS